MKIYSWNVNGLRAVERKGNLDDFIKTHNPDILLLQEIKGKPEVFSEHLTENETYTQHYHPAQKAGYSGVGIWTKKTLGNFEVSRGMKGWRDTEGRVITIMSEKYPSIVSTYVPNGGKSPEAHKDKLSFYPALRNHLKQLKNFVIGGDFNCAYTELDLAEPERHKNTIGFLPEEKEQLGKFFTDGFIDTFRSRHPNKAQYSYWDNFDFKYMGKKPRDINIGWRIDYIMADKNTDKKIKSALIHDDIFGSDHCPVSVTIN